MKVLLTGGGTAGHINPALAIGGYIKEKNPDADIRYMGSRGSMEERLVSKTEYPLYLVSVQGFNRKNIFKNIKTVKMMLAAVNEAKKIMREFKPDVVIGVGGYVSYPAICAAEKMGIPAVIHEQNAYPGISNKMSAKHATRIMLTVPESKKYLSKFVDKCVVTGLPIRSELVMSKKNEERATLGVDGRPLVLSVGGSLGAKCFNEVMSTVLIKDAKEGKIQHIHGTGREGYAAFTEKLDLAGADYGDNKAVRVLEYVDMTKCLAACDIIVSRCGASSLAEIEAQGKPSVLIPSPNVTENHQYYNGMALVSRGAAVMIEEKDLTAEKLSATIHELTQDKDKLSKMSAAAADMAIYDAAERIYGVILDAIREKKKV